MFLSILCGQRGRAAAFGDPDAGRTASRCALWSFTKGGSPLGLFFRPFTRRYGKHQEIYSGVRFTYKSTFDQVLALEEAEATKTSVKVSEIKRRRELDSIVTRVNDTSATSGTANVSGGVRLNAFCVHLTYLYTTLSRPQEKTYQKTFSRC